MITTVRAIRREEPALRQSLTAHRSGHDLRQTTFYPHHTGLSAPKYDYDSGFPHSRTAAPTSTNYQYEVMLGQTFKRQNNLNRWYDPKVGRWISEDPIGFAAGDSNLYRYVGNSPTNFTDPNGHQKQWTNATISGLADFEDGSTVADSFWARWISYGRVVDFTAKYKWKCGNDGMTPDFALRGMPDHNIENTPDDLALPLGPIPFELGASTSMSVEIIDTSVDRCAEINGKKCATKTIDLAVSYYVSYGLSASTDFAEAGWLEWRSKLWTRHYEVTVNCCGNGNKSSLVRFVRSVDHHPNTGRGSGLKK